MRLGFLSPDDFLSGKAGTLPVQRCPECSGTGVKHLEGMGDIPCVCGQRICPPCCGTGKFWSEVTCWNCDGYGYQVAVDLEPKFQG